MKNKKRNDINPMPVVYGEKKINRFVRLIGLVFGILFTFLSVAFYQLLFEEKVFDFLGESTLLWMLVDIFGEIATVEIYFFSLFIIIHVKKSKTPISDFFSAIGWITIAVCLSSLLEVFLGGMPTVGVEIKHLCFSTLTNNFSEQFAFALTGFLTVLFSILFILTASKSLCLPVDTILISLMYAQNIFYNLTLPIKLGFRQLNANLLSDIREKEMIAAYENQSIETQYDTMSEQTNVDFKRPVDSDIDSMWNNSDFENDADNEEMPFEEAKHIPQTKEEIASEKLDSLGIDCDVTKICDGHRITRYYLSIPPSQSLSIFTRRKSDIALAFTAKHLSYGVNTKEGSFFMDVDKPREEWRNVQFVDVLMTEEFKQCKLGVALGFDVENKPIVFELSEMRHTLVGGKNGSGKSNITHLIVCSLMMRSAMITIFLVDTRQIVAAHYKGCVGIKTTIQAKMGVKMCADAIKLMRTRDKLFAENRCSDIATYNKKFPNDKRKMIVLIIEELSDLLDVFPTKEGKLKFLQLIKQITTGGRKSGIYLVASTQYPTKEKLGNETAENFTTKIGGLVDNAISAKTVMGDSKLYPIHTCQGHGDFYLKSDRRDPTRFTAAFLNDIQLEKITNKFRRQGEFTK